MFPGSTAVDGAQTIADVLAPQKGPALWDIRYESELLNLQCNASLTVPVVALVSDTCFPARSAF